MIQNEDRLVEIIIDLQREVLALQEIVLRERYERRILAVMPVFVPLWEAAND
jgi:hypothetical protein